MSIQDMEDLKQHYLDEMKSLINEFSIKDYRDEKIDIKINELKENFNGMSIEINKKKKLQQLEQMMTRSFLSLSIFDVNDDEEYTIQVREYGDDDEELFLDEVKRIQQILERTSFDAITPDFPITNSLNMGDAHLSTILETESDELIKSSVENLVPIPSESEDFPISKVSVIDDEPFFDEDVPKKIYSNHLFDEEIISTKIDLHHFNAESDLIESLLNQDTSIISSPKIDSLLEEFSGELAHIDLILPGINETDFDPEEEIRLVEKFLYDNSSPRPPKEFNSENSDAIIESFSPSPIPVEDSDSLMEEIDLFLTPDDSMPLGIENDDYDSEGDILFLEELLSNDSPSLPENESFHFDVPSSPRPPAKPPDDDEIEPDTGVLTAKVVGDISKHYVLMPRLLPTQPTLCPVIDTLLPFSSENEDKVHLLSHRGFKAFQLFSDIYGGNIPTLECSYLHFYPPDQHKYVGLESSLVNSLKNKRFRGLQTDAYPF
ncbi:hypothetical protein Tco_1284710 [Tanacetum coccineum]